MNFIYGSLIVFFFFFLKYRTKKMFDQYQKSLGVDLWSTHYAVYFDLIFY